ncbi:hypothetical protein PHYPSEUDO_006852 [Phytophthora pseudosyringae]|uniref:Transmembrane protein n=1 Tax=Phytophthora pseudosyringae TaxID=221518 RepID=A0A8T1WFE5_9STRA|nr:hypothetical protein PHYPSEUDO_006852 [Phytophthora pseudosyringae]
MRSGPLRALRSANISINAHLSRHAWAGWLFISLSELVFFSAYRLSNLSDLVKASTTPEDDTTPTRIYGVLLGVVQDLVVISFLIAVLSSFDAAINRSACCNDTAPNGCADCFTRGIPFRSRTKLVLKRLLRLTVIYAACLLSVALFAVDVVTVRSYQRHYKFGWSSHSEELVTTDAQESRIVTHVLFVVLFTQGMISSVTAVWFDLTRWTPLSFATRWKGLSQGLPTVNTSRPSVNYLVMDPADFCGPGDSENLSSFFDSNNLPIRGTQLPQAPAILSDDRRDLPPSRLHYAVVGIGLAGVSFLFTPLLVLLITNFCPPAVASIALNSNLNDPICAITSLSFVPS